MCTLVFHLLLRPQLINNLSLFIVYGDMGGIENLPIWLVPFLTSKYFDENDKHGKIGKACACEKLANHYRPYFYIHCEEGHLCPKTCLTAGGIYVNHHKLQVRKVTERNSIHIDDSKEHSKLDEGIMKDIREYCFNNNFFILYWAMT